jgi:hypothetical protein
MPLTWDQVAELLIAALSSTERESSVVYLDERHFPAGSVIEIDGEEKQLFSPVMVAFVDLKPEANWGHDCRYLFVDPETGELQTAVAQFPPFLRDVPETLQVIWKGAGVPEWAVAYRPPGES